MIYQNRTSQAKCLFDHGQTDPTLDHGAEMIYPGERFDADQQCKCLLPFFFSIFFNKYYPQWDSPSSINSPYTHPNILNIKGMLKYGKDSIRSRAQPLKEICRDLHCQRDRYTWTSHPALEGTACSETKVNLTKISSYIHAVFI